jgi:hypothetical protein
LEKSDADSSPVGEAQNEPNENPKLTRPTEGRGLSNQLSSMLPSLPNISLPSLQFYKRIFMIVIVVIILAVVGFVMLYFKL